jgi:hypothetical protein
MRRPTSYYSDVRSFACIGDTSIVCNSCREGLHTYVHVRISSRDFSCPLVCGEVRSRPRINRLFQQLDDGFVSVGSRES